MRGTVERTPEQECADGDEVVVIDDDPDALEVATLAIERAGLRARPFRDAAEALRAIRKKPPALVMTDLSMRPLHGVELARTMRATPALARIPLIALTGVTDPEWATICQFDAYIRKPVELQEIADLAGTLIPKSKVIARS